MTLLDPAAAVRPDLVHHPLEALRAAAAAVPPAALGLMAGLSAVAMWGAYLAFARAGVSAGLTPFDFVALRYATAGAIMLPWLLAHGIGSLAGHGWRRGGALAVAAGPIFIALGVGGYLFAPLSHGAVIQPATITVGGALLAWALLGERLTRSRIAGGLLILAGVAAIASTGGAEAAAGAWVGDGLFVLAGLFWVAFTLMVRRWSVSPLAATAIVSVLSAAVAVPAYLAFGTPSNLLALPPATLLTQVVVQGVLSGVLAVLAFTKSVQLLGASRAALFPAMVPAAALLIGIPVTGEVPHGLEWLGMAVASAGLAVAIGAVRLGRGR